MKVVICGSVDFTPEIAAAAAVLSNAGHSVEVPRLTQRIMAGEISYADFLREKQANGDGIFRAAESGSLIRRYYDLIKEADAVLIVNATKKGVDGYIGANTFLEIGFAHVLNKQLYLLNPWAPGTYNDELEEIKPTVIKGDLSLIK